MPGTPPLSRSKIQTDWRKKHKQRCMEEDLVDLVIPVLRWIVRRPKEDDDITRKKWWGKVRGKTGTVGFDSDAFNSADRICLSFPLFLYSERSNLCSNN